MASSFFERFRRVTASTSYLPEIDGLRFLAVFWVAIVMHAVNYLNIKFYNFQLIQGRWWTWVVNEGTHGMYLFFMISGFILSLPFAKAYIKKQESVSLKRYYLRRLTRLEPPYIIALIIFFLLHLFVTKKFPIEELVPSFLASAVYLHQVIYDSHSIILPVAWSLEVEVQFYIVAPLFCLIFKVRSLVIRRAICVVLIIGSMLWLPISKPFGGLIDFLHYFMAGVLLADLYVCKGGVASTTIKGYLMGILSLVVLLAIPSYYWAPKLFLKLVVMFVLFYQVLFNTRMKTMFSAKGITLIGGMCYSIYLLHFGIISGFGTLLLSLNKRLDYNHALFYLLAITGLILLLSAVFFYYVEKPFMQFRLKRLEQKSKKERPI